MDTLATLSAEKCRKFEPTGTVDLFGIIDKDTDAVNEQNLFLAHFGVVPNWM